MRKSQINDSTPLLKEHEIRLRCAEASLSPTPLTDYGVGRHVEDARRALVEEHIVPSEALNWLPDVTDNFRYLDA